jgi:hypothetical protein
VFHQGEWPHVVIGADHQAALPEGNWRMSHADSACFSGATDEGVAFSQPSQHSPERVATD